MEKKIVLTYEGMRKMEEELIELKTVKRKVVAQKIKEARAQGDLSENAEYDAAKEEQGEIETRIVELEKMLRNAEVIDEDEINMEHVALEGEVEYSIVGSTEANPVEGKISNESPVGKALIGAKVGDVVEAQTPGGIGRFKVLEISR